MAIAIHYPYVMGRGRGEDTSSILYGDHAPSETRSAVIAAEAAEQIRALRKGPAVSAHIWLDDRAGETVYLEDISQYLETLSESELRDFQDCDWELDYPADNVAHYYADYNKEVAAIISITEQTGSGFECRVNHQQAEAWLEHHQDLPE